MQVQINFGSVDNSPALEEHVQGAVDQALEYFADRITRVEIHLHDDNASKAGTHDKRVVMEARPAGFAPLAVDHRGDDLYQVIDEAAGKLGRALKRKLDRADARPS